MRVTEIGGKETSRTRREYGFRVTWTLFLALGAVMAAAARDDDSFDWSFADQARLSFAAVDAVLKLEESFFAVGVNVIGDGRSAESDRFFQNILAVKCAASRVDRE